MVLGEGWKETERETSTSVALSAERQSCRKVVCVCVWCAKRGGGSKIEWASDIPSIAKGCKRVGFPQNLLLSTPREAISLRREARESCMELFSTHLWEFRSGSRPRWNAAALTEG